ncbi:MAG: hypothetical protein WCT37_01875 [Patescibacteria group bacterium]
MVECPSCHKKWYDNHCWQCGSNVDSRTTTRCPDCHWYHCPVCGVCSLEHGSRQQESDQDCYEADNCLPA